MQVGKYELIRELAVGGMAEVFLARAAGPMGFEKQLVLKRILPHLARDSVFVQMFLSEATLAARLTHPNIVQIFDFGESGGSYFLAMEYVDGPSLRTLLDDSLRRGERLPPVLAARIIASACEGLAFAHELSNAATGKPLELVHRDISPDNLLLSRQGAVKVADFGIAKAAGQRHRTQTGVIKGKVAYMPPEQLRNLPLDRRVDVYALGVVFYELLTGQRPYEAPDTASLMQAILFEPLVPAVQRRPDLPEPVQHILQRALAKEPAQRYPDCVAFQADLEQYILTTGKPVTAQHIAQLIAQVSPPAPQALVPADDAPLTETALRPAPAPGSPPPGEVHLPNPTAEERAQAPMAEARVPANPGPQADSATAAEAPPAPARGTRRLRAVLAGGVLLAAGGGFLLWGKAPPPRPALTAPAMPGPSTEPSKAAPAPTASPAEPAAAPGEASARQSAEEPRANQDAKTGILEFEVRPEAVVYLEGKRLGRAPPLGILDINPGTYRVRFENKKLGKVVERPVEVKAGQTTFIQVDLLHEEEAQKP